jgi:hypothetical protein
MRQELLFDVRCEVYPKTQNRVKTFAAVPAASVYPVFAGLKRYLGSFATAYQRGYAEKFRLQTLRSSSLGSLNSVTSICKYARKNGHDKQSQRLFESDRRRSNNSVLVSAA